MGDIDLLMSQQLLLASKPDLEGVYRFWEDTSKEALCLVWMSLRPTAAFEHQKGVWEGGYS